jgi:hypothetical protein
MLRASSVMKPARIVIAVATATSFFLGCALVLDFDYDRGDGNRVVVTPADGPIGEGGPTPIACTDQPSHVCTKAVVPAQWIAVALSRPGEASSSACPDGYGDPFDVSTIPDAGPATCTVCACSGNAGACNGAIEMDFYRTKDCSGDPHVQFVRNPSPPYCYDMAMAADGTDTSAIVRPVPSGDSCIASGGDASLPDAGVTHGKVCRQLGIAAPCISGGTCITSVPPPFVACVAAAGDVACPEGFADRLRTGSGSDPQDQRGCSPCRCASNVCVGATAEARFSPSAVCTDDLGDATVPVISSTCGDVPPIAMNPMAHWHGVLLDAGAGGTCVPVADSGRPIGAMVDTNPWTICCPQ